MSRVAPRPWRGGIANISAAAVLAGCGTAAAIVTTRSHIKYAATPTSSGVVNPAAVPLGDRYLSTSPKVGYVDSCITNFGGAGGAQAEGPWIDNSNKTWDSLTKLAVQGSVQWPTAYYRVKTVGDRRVISFNDLPIDHTTGVFPIRPTDPASRYDRNPNHIAAHPATWGLPLHPKLAKTPSCTGGGAIGVLTDGVKLYNALDGEGRDASAHEVLDRCGGHPDMSGNYHHHEVPTCIIDRVPKGRTTLVGYALDGFGIYVQKSANGKLPGNASLDACHGTTSRVRWDGKVTRIYHYLATLEYPYTIGCFRGTPLKLGPGGPPP